MNDFPLFSIFFSSFIKLCFANFIKVTIFGDEFLKLNENLRIFNFKGDNCNFETLSKIDS